MRQEWTATLKNAPDRVLLVRRKVAVAERRADHTGQRQVRTIEITEPEIVEAEVVLLGQAFCALPVFPNPITKPVFQLLLLFACGDRLRLIDSAASILVLVVGGGGAPIQRLLDQIRRAEASGTVRGGVVHDVLRTIVELDGPGRDCPRVANSY